jgi:hypothetical protein
MEQSAKSEIGSNFLNINIYDFVNSRNVLQNVMKSVSCYNKIIDRKDQRDNRDKIEKGSFKNKEKNIKSNDSKKNRERSRYYYKDSVSKRNHKIHSKSKSRSRSRTRSNKESSYSLSDKNFNNEKQRKNGNSFELEREINMKKKLLDKIHNFSEDT